MSLFKKENAQKLAKKLRMIADKNYIDLAEKTKSISLIAVQKSKEIGLKAASKTKDFSEKATEASKEYLGKRWPGYSKYIDNTLNFCSKRKKKILAGTGIILAGGFVFTSCTKESCPSGFLSMGGGYCREVVCKSLDSGDIDLMAKRALMGQESNYQDKELEARAKEAGLTCKGKGGIMGSYLKWGKTVIPSR